ncbi:hypothetical protein JB92DRAFT_1625597 [Gautieria morchelliformis]|nr:hypothetical protein JB92DRAFT_1625597 [Gautieria morchelliformis]
MSSGSAEDIIVLGGQLQATRYCLVSGLALLFYEHLLTLGDEVRYIWSSRISLAGFLFFVTRCFVPISLSVITAAATTKWGDAVLGHLELAFFTVVLIASSILLLLRVYALYNRSKWILCYLSSVILIQFVVCTLLSGFSDHGLLPMPPIDIPVFQGCLYPPPSRPKNGTLAPVIVEIAYDVSIIGLIMAKGWKDRSLNGLRDRGGILRIIVKDGIIYFL